MAELKLKDIARKLLIEHGWDEAAALANLDTMLARPYVQERVPALVWEALAEAVRNTWRDSRHNDTFVATLQPGEESEYFGLTTFYQGMSKSWLDWPLSSKDGLTLGQATRERLETAIAMWEKQIRTQRTNLAWVRLILAKLPDDHVMVADVLTADEVGELRAQAAVSVTSEPVEA